MTELLLILLIIVAVLFIAFHKPRPSLHEQVMSQRDPLEKLVCPEVIEDSSHLKAELFSAREELKKSFQDLGQLQSQLRVLSNQNQTLERDKVASKEAFDKMMGQKKSGEVRLGMVSEQLVSLLPEFPVPLHTLKFFGNPIDYIAIDMDEEYISFIEIKSGNSVLSDKQKKIRKMIHDKRVRFFEVRIDDKGMKVK